MDEKKVKYVQDERTGRLYEVGEDGKAVPVPPIPVPTPTPVAEPSKLGWAGIGMLISGLGTIAFGVAGIINANQAAAQVSKEMAFLFFGSFSTTMAYFTKDRLMTG